MNKNVIHLNWEKTLAKWRPSKGARAIGEGELNRIIEILDTIACSIDPDQLLPMGLKVFVSLQMDNLYKSELFEIASQQAKEHRKVWQTHLDEKSHFTFELPYFHQRGLELRYLKVKMNIKFYWRPELIRQVYFSYHRSSVRTEVYIL